MAYYWLHYIYEPLIASGPANPKLAMLYIRVGRRQERREPGGGRVFRGRPFVQRHVYASFRNAHADVYLGSGGRFLPGGGVGEVGHGRSAPGVCMEGEDRSLKQ